MKRRYLLALLICGLVLPATAMRAAAVAPAFNEYQGPATIGANAVVTGPDGNLWIASNASNEIWKMSPSGTFLNQYTVPTANSRPWGITAGADGNLWFTEDQGGKVGRITTAGVITEFRLPVSTNRPQGIALGPDCNIWFVELFPAKIGRITPSGSLTEFPLSSISAEVEGITAGPDGNLWFTEYGANKIGRITPTGTITEFDVDTTVNLGGGGPSAITLGWDGNLWFLMEVSHSIGKITPAGTETYYNMSVGSAATGGGITWGPDGNVWFGDPIHNALGVITPAGTITEYLIPTASASPQGMTTGPDGNVWVAEYGTGRMGQIVLPKPTLAGPPRNITTFAGVGYVRVQFSAPFYDGGAAITGYTVTPYIGTVAQTPVSGTAPEVDVTGLSTTTAYTFLVTADNSVGHGRPGTCCGTSTPSDRQTAVSTEQYHLANSNGTSWVDIDTINLHVNVTSTSAASAVVGGNIDLFTANAGYNQDIGIFVSIDGAADQLVAWKESGGFAGTFSPNAAFVQTVQPITANSTYVFKLKWKTNKNAAGATIYAGAGPIAGLYSPTRLSVQLIPPVPSFSAVSAQQYHLTNANGTTWVEISSTNLRVSLSPGADAVAMLGGNVDLFTDSAGYNQDIGIFVSVDSGADQLVAWKESGGFAGTFSPNAAFVQAFYPMSTGSTYVFKLEWKTNKPAAGATIYAGAGPIGGLYSPTRLSLQLIAAAASFDFVSGQQYNLASNNGTTWVEISSTDLRVSLSPGADAIALVGANVDLFTGKAGYNQDIGIFVSVDSAADQLVGWKESGGFAGTFSPNAAFLQALYPVLGGHTYVFKLKWKTNKNAAGATIYAGAGPISGQYSPTRLSVQLPSA
jgi:streptogramin lyase